MNAADDSGDTALHLSTRSGFIEIMKLLRKDKADPLWKNLVRNQAMPVYYDQSVQVLLNSILTRSSRMTFQKRVHNDKCK